MSSLRLKSTFIAGILLLAGCAEKQPSAEPSSEPTRSETAAELATARKDALAMVEAVELPADAPEPPLSGSCSTGMCVVSQVTFGERDWPAAWRGSYDAMRNVAFCRANSCDGAVMIDRVEGCAWRAVILEKRAAEANEGDATNLEIDCGVLTDTQKTLAISKAEIIAAKID